ncbi:MAG: mechanosensitive ion channel family protein [Lachnospiraceae bacterium]|nr:mechanosensitive ion channel family protein [Lachnospiraceae bacterium]
MTTWILHEAETETSAELLQETVAVAQEVAQDIQNLKPNVMLETIKSWIPGLMGFGYRLLIAIIIFLIGSRIISLIKKLLNKTFEKMEIEVSLRKFLVSCISAVLYTIVVLMAAEKLGFNPASIIAIIGSAGVAVALSLQESLSNFAGGIVILISKPFRVGDYIIASGMEGTVMNIGLIYTKMLTVDNKMTVIPNGGLANSSITNVTAEDHRRVDIFVGISYTSDLRAAKDILLRIMDENPLVLHEENRMPEVFVWELGDSAVTIGGRAWSKTEDYWTVKFEVTEAVKLAYDEAGIEIPYNQLDVNIRRTAEK